MTKVFMVTENGPMVLTHCLHIKMIRLTGWGVQHAAVPDQWDAVMAEMGNTECSKSHCAVEHVIYLYIY